MLRRVKFHAAAALLVSLIALVASASALAGSGGASLTAGSGGFGSGGTVNTSGNPLVGAGNGTVSASGSGITVSTTASALLHDQLEFAGTVPGSGSAGAVEIERLGRETSWTWRPTARASVGPDGSFRATWTTDHIGQFAIRVVISSAGARAAAASPAVAITVYRRAVATWYGPGFFGRRMACGGRLSRGTFGVANRRLPCGTKVALYYRGRTLTVPVVDRGPYANGAEWDLTQAASRALGVGGTDTIGAVSLAAVSSNRVAAVR